MIDTDKYEGHTEGPWKAFEDIEGADTDSPYRTGAWMVGNAISKSTAPPLHFTDEHDPHAYNVMGICSFKPNRQNNEADARLIADAPLLLAEVKRLQMYEQEHKELWDIIADFSPKDSEEDNDTYQEWLDSVSQGYMGSVYEYVMMKQEEMIE